MKKPNEYLKDLNVLKTVLWSVRRRYPAAKNLLGLKGAVVQLKC